MVLCDRPICVVDMSCGLVPMQSMPPLADCYSVLLFSYSLLLWLDLGFAGEGLPLRAGLACAGLLEMFWCWVATSLVRATVAQGVLPASRSGRSGCCREVSLFLRSVVAAGPRFVHSLLISCRFFLLFTFIFFFFLHCLIFIDALVLCMICLQAVACRAGAMTV